MGDRQYVPPKMVWPKDRLDPDTERRCEDAWQAYKVERAEAIRCAKLAKAREADMFREVRESQPFWQRGELGRELGY